MIRLDWPDEAGVSVAEFLHERGLPTIVHEKDWWLELECDDEPAVQTALESYIQGTPRGGFVKQLPPAMREHAGHLRDYEQAIRNGTPVTAAQTQHVLADVIRWLRLSEDRL